jgi:hypothetical protein
MKLLVHTLLRPLPRVAVALILGAGAVAPAAIAHADADATAQTAPTTAITPSGATLNGVVGPAQGRTYYLFEYGTTTNYSNATKVGSVPAANAPRPVSAPVAGLTPGTVYHFRLITGNGSARRVGVGADQTFTTATSPVPAAVVPVAAPAPEPAVAAAPAPVPGLGTSVVVAPVEGIVRVKAPGAAGYTALQAGGSVPVGAAVDARAGTVRLTAALTGGRAQAAEFHGGIFRVRQAAKGGGMTDIDLRGPALACSRARAGAAAVTTKRRRPVRKLWAQDAGGRFRTHGRNSVATVRGTKWVTTDTCAGTRTTVTEGAVSVRDVRRGRSVLVRAGHSYLARTRQAGR